MTKLNVLKLLIVPLVFGIQACGASNMVPGDAGVVGGSSWLYGNWSGTYTRINPANGSTLYTTPATAVFQGRDRQTGMFRINLAERGNSQAAGAFQAEGSALYFGVQETNAFALFGDVGETTQYSYELSGKSLLIYNSNGTFDLASKVDPQQDPQVNPTPVNPGGSTGPVPGNNGGPDQNQSIFAIWACEDAVENTWQIDIQAAGEFRIDVTTTANALLWMKGSHIVIDKATAADELKPFDAMLTSEASNQAAYKNLKLFVARKAELLEVTIPNEGEAPTVISCSKKE